MSQTGLRAHLEPRTRFREVEVVPSHPYAGGYQVLRNTVIACAVDMERRATNRLAPLPAKKASFVEPMECLSVPRLPEGSQWLWEIKLDCRALAIKSGSGVTLFSRRLKYQTPIAA